MDRDWHRDLAAVTRFVYGQTLAKRFGSGEEVCLWTEIGIEIWQR
jgi:hypothetical protein